MSATKKSGRVIISAYRKSWNDWRSKNKPDDKWSQHTDPPDVLWIRDIAVALRELAWVERNQETMRPLELAACDERWDLIQDAANLLEYEALPLDDKRRFRNHSMWIAYRLSVITEIRLVKSEILGYIGTVHPDIFEAIPLTAQGKTFFWKRIESYTGQIPPHRGNIDPSREKVFQGLIKRGIEARKTPFPEFIDPLPFLSD